MPKRTKEDCAKEALKYSRRVDFSKGNKAVYDYSIKHSWLEEICSHMVATFEYWDFCKCKDVASKYKSRSEFSRLNANCYQAARRNNWLDEICSHMPEPRKSRTLEECIDCATSCKTRSEFREKYPLQYRYSVSKGWLDQVYSNLPEEKITRPLSRTRTRESIAELVNNYKTLSDFGENEASAYQACLKYGWKDLLKTLSYFSLDKRGTV